MDEREKVRKRMYDTYETHNGKERKRITQRKLQTVWCTHQQKPNWSAVDKMQCRRTTQAKVIKKQQQQNQPNSISAGNSEYQPKNKSEEEEAMHCFFPYLDFVVFFLFCFVLIPDDELVLEAHCHE